MSPNDKEELKLLYYVDYLFLYLFLDFRVVDLIDREELQSVKKRKINTDFIKYKLLNLNNYLKNLQFYMNLLFQKFHVLVLNLHQEVHAEEILFAVREFSFPLDQYHLSITIENVVYIKWKII